MTLMTVSRSPYPVVVIGAGMAGLTAAFRLQQAGVDVQVLEASDGVGGVVRSRRVAGHVFEDGPTTVMSTAEHLSRLIDDAGLRPRAMLSADVAGRRLVWRHGRLHALPEKPPQLLTCGALSPLGRLRLLLEPFVPPKRDDEPETLEAFARRRLGREATAGLVDPFVTGVYAGRIDHLGVDALPRLRSWEREHGSLFKALREQRKSSRSDSGSEPERKGPPPLISFPEGLGELPERLGSVLGSRLLSGCRVLGIGRVGSHWRVTFQPAQSESRTLLASALIVAAPAPVSAHLLEPWVGDEAFHFRDLDYPHVATVGLGFRRSDVSHPLNAFGLLCAGDSRLRDDVLGVLFVSSIFPQRAPEGEVTLTVMIGGARDPRAAELDDAALADRARGALAELVGARGEPTAQSVIRWPRAIPQYPPGHALELEKLFDRLSRLTGIFVAGNWIDGVGLEAAVASGDRAATEALALEWTASRG